MLIRFKPILLSVAWLALAALSPGLGLPQVFWVSPARADISAALEPLIACKFGWRVFNETPEGIRIASGILGRPVKEFADLKSLAMRLDSPELSPFAEELGIRLGAIKMELGRSADLSALARSFLSVEGLPGQLSFLPSSALQGYEALGEAFAAPALALEQVSTQLGVVPLRKIPMGARTGESRVLPLRSAFGPGERLYLGMSSAGDYSFVFGAQLYSGQILSSPVIKEAASHVLKHGLIVRFDALPLQVASDLKSIVGAQPQSINISCVNGVCSTLAKAGIQLGGEGELPIYRSRALERIVRQGFNLPSGQRIEMEIYLNSQTTFDEIFETYARLDQLNRRAFSIQLAKIREVSVQLTADNFAQEVGHADPAVQARILTLIKNGVPAVVIVLLPFSLSELSGDAPRL